MKVPQFYVRSNVHMTNLDNTIQRLLVNESLIDVTLACDGHKFQCHRLVLAAASPLFEELLKEHPKEHPIVIIPIGVKWQILKSLIDFMYRGQTCINQAELKTLIESAELLQIIGLYDPQTQFREIYGEDDGDEQQMSITEENMNETKNENEEIAQEVQEPEQKNTNFDDCNPNHGENNGQENLSQEDIRDEKDEIKEVQETNDNCINEPENNVETDSDDKNKEYIVDYIEIEDSQDEMPPPPPPPPKEGEDVVSKNQTTEENDEIRANHEDDKETTKQENNEMEVGETNNLDSNNQQNVPCAATASAETQTAETMPTIRVKPAIKLINLFKLNRPGDENQSPSKVPWTYIHIPATPGSNIQSPSEQVPLKNPFTSLPKLMPKPRIRSPSEQVPLKNKFTSLPKLLPKPAPLVISNPVHEFNETPASSCVGSVPSFLKFNSSSMAISVKNLDRTKSREKLNVLNMALQSEPSEQEQKDNLPPEYEDDGNEANREPDYTDINEEIDLGMIKDEHDVKTESMDFEYNNDSKAEEGEAENIICQPNVSYIYDGEEYGRDVEHVEDDEDGVCIDYDRLVAETYGKGKKSSPQQKAKKKPINKKSKKLKAPQRSSVKPIAPKNYNNLTLFNTAAPSEPTNSQQLSQRLKDPPTLVPLSVMHAGLGPKHLFCKNSTKIEPLDNDNNFSNSVLRDTTIQPAPNTHTRKAVILRNPRCNQPRHYSTESLYAALMAVKFGDSIYRASRLHQVPRKTLRNWMKRWDIKSQFPMPKQLKDAATKKKLNQDQSA
ncbi:protein tramtrack, alpha isoform-like isoform X2 [Episyrphus balteatus]|uniref:protein tramtrack, alpha isoform-like isoform X2 n=1 Tax=Episyrphus balteatus TaxID=286459 RepID=UPI0024859A58|nr:protein tramtrack, alpha isoform-like isoform X2 [Episyrphus balteatus]